MDLQSKTPLQSFPFILEAPKHPVHAPLLLAAGQVCFWSRIQVCAAPATWVPSSSLWALKTRQKLPCMKGWRQTPSSVGKCHRSTQVHGAQSQASLEPTDPAEASTERSRTDEYLPFTLCPLLFTGLDPSTGAHMSTSSSYSLPYWKMWLQFLYF